MVNGLLNWKATPMLMRGSGRGTRMPGFLSFNEEVPVRLPAGELDEPHEQASGGTPENRAKPTGRRSTRSRRAQVRAARGAAGRFFSPVIDQLVKALTRRTRKTISPIAATARGNREETSWAPTVRRGREQQRQQQDGDRSTITARHDQLPNRSSPSRRPSAAAAAARPRSTSGDGEQNRSVDACRPGKTGRRSSSASATETPNATPPAATAGAQPLDVDFKPGEEQQHAQAEVLSTLHRRVDARPAEDGRSHHDAEDDLNTTPGTAARVQPEDGGNEDGDPAMISTLLNDTETRWLQRSVN